MGKLETNLEVNALDLRVETHEEKSFEEIQALAKQYNEQKRLEAEVENTEPEE